MNILAIECSHPKASLCLSSQGQIISEYHWQAERNHDQYLFPALQEALDHLDRLSQQSPATLDYILVGAGPGSYGGIRVAIAAATGIQLIKDCPVAAIDSWAQLCESADEHIISDAKRGGWTLRTPDGSIQVQSTEQILALQNSGTHYSTTEKEESLLPHGLQAQRYQLKPTARGLIQSWQQLSPAQQEQLIAQEPSPIYVRPPHITQAKRKPWEC